MMIPLSRTILPALLALLLLVPGCKPRRPPEEMKGTLIYGFEGVFKTFDPARQVYAQESAIIQQVLEPLLIFNQDLILQPRLATSWETPDNCKTWIFQLREGVAFHDGTPFNADAVKLHFERILDPVTASTRRKNYEDIERIDVIDDHPISFTMIRPNCILPEKLVAPSASIPSPTALKERGEGIGQRPVGTGPFMMDEWIPDVAIKLRKYPGHWNAENYHIERLEFRPLRENTTRLILLEQGMIDMADISFAQVNVARNSSDMTLMTTPQLSIRYIGFNTQKPPFNDVRVRQAANYAVDKEAMVKYMFFGVGEAARGPFPSVLPAFNKDMRKYDYDPARAKALLAEAGYPNGLKATMWTHESGIYRVAADAAVDYLEQVGINVDMKILDSGVYWDRFDEYNQRDGTQFPLKEGIFDMYVGGWVGGEVPHGFLEPLFKTRSYSNSSFYSNPEVDRLLKAFKTKPDPADRDQMYREMQAIIVEDAPWIFAFHGQINLGVRNRVKGYRLHPGLLYFFDGVRLDDSTEAE